MSTMSRMSWFSIRSHSSSISVPSPIRLRLIQVILYLIWLYTVTGRNSESAISKYDHPVPNGHTRMTSMEQRRMRDVEEFELGGLLEEDEDAVPRESSSMENAPLAKRSSIERE